MRKYLVFFLIVICCQLCVSAQINVPLKDRLKVYIDCYSGCNMTFIRTEINIVDFLLDRQAADVHILITDQNTGSGGDEYQIIFFGQNQFNNIKDTIHFINDANATQYEERDLIVKYLKIGLTPFIAKTKMAKEIQIQMKTDKVYDTILKNTELNTKDPWNYWVFRISAGGNLNKDAVYKESNFNGRLSASRITEATKVGFEFSGGKNKSDFAYEDDLGNVTKFTNKNNRFDFEHFLVKSISEHWSWAYVAKASRNTFSNNKFRALISTGIEYNIFPYSLVNTKSFTIAYLSDVRRNNYIDSTLYEKTKETLFRHGIEAKLRINQKWGNVSFGAEYYNYLHDWKFFNLNSNVSLNIRITGGLSFNIYTAAELTRDQLFLPKGGATPQEVLTRQRQLATGYRFVTNFGLSYRFGSMLNNFVNPRFN